MDHNSSSSNSNPWVMDDKRSSPNSDPITCVTGVLYPRSYLNPNNITQSDIWCSLHGNLNS
jgi:hypothetical protein